MRWVKNISRRSCLDKFAVLSVAHRENLARFQSPCFYLLHKKFFFISNVYNFVTETSYFAKYFAEVSTEVVFRKEEAFDGTSSQPNNLLAVLFFKKQ